MKLTLIAALLASVLNINVIPYPQSVEMTKGTCRVSGTGVNYDSKLDSQSKKAISEFAAQLSFICGKVCPVAEPVGLKQSIEKAGKFKGFAFIEVDSLADEAYNIEIQKRSIKVSASSYHGFLYAIQTIKQMLPPAIYGKTPAPQEKWVLPCCSIKDQPRFAYRGMHLDCSRHFFSVEEVKRYLDVMSMYKLNRFHWHLTDDQGWRIEIKKYPLLTEVGAYRRGTMIGHDWGSCDNVRYGGYYTQDEIRDVIAYADKLGITIIPEVDLPGHMLAAMAAYPELGCTGGPYEPWVVWGVSDQVLCVGKEHTFDFLKDVLGEIADLFPSEYFHIGGDECPKTAWHNCPVCQAKIAELGLHDTATATAEQYLQNYVTSRVQKMLADKGKKIIGWDEILEGELGEGATVMSWRGVEGGIQAANAGFDAIMTPSPYLYFDYCQSKDQSTEPLTIGGYLPLDKVYGYEPTEGLTPEAAKHIIGVQANLWTEYIATNDHLEYMLLPRMLAASEVQWCSSDHKDYARFLSSINAEQYSIFDVIGMKYRRY